MTSLTYDQAQDEMLALHKSAWDTTGLPALYQGTKEDRPTDTAWCRVYMRHATGTQASLAGGNGQRRYQRTGLLVTQIFVPVGKGLQQAYELAKVLSDAFEGAHTTGGVWFRDVRLNEEGRDGNFEQVNHLVEFTYDEIK